MAKNARLTSLPEKLETGLLLLERGHFLRSGGKMATGKLPKKVLDLFRRLKAEEIEWVMVGAEAVNIYLARPRATVDVDIVVRQKHLRKVKKILKELCSGLKDGDLKDTEVHFKGTLSDDPNRLEVDVIKSQSHELFGIALDERVVVDGVPVPRVEVLLALKFLSAVSPWRSEADKHMDISDFIRAFKENRSRIDRILLIDLASRAHKNARKEFEEFLDAVEKDRPVTL
jgi:hypothetical protein